MKDLSDIKIWKQNFGLLPIHLRPLDNQVDFLMLNGGHGDFCLQTTDDNNDKKDYYSKSWSTNTKHFVVINDDKIKIFNWARDKFEEVDRKQVTNNFDEFYYYLYSKSYKSDNDVVPFIIDIFRQF